jgi:hypothetical protein
MLMGGFGPFIFLAALGNPPVFVTGVAVGLVVRKPWQLLPCASLPPIAYWVFYSAFYSVDHSTSSLPFLVTAGAVWSSAAFVTRRAWTS